MAEVLFWVAVVLLGIGALMDFFTEHRGEGLFMAIIFAVLLCSYFLNGEMVVVGGEGTEITLSAFLFSAVFWFWVVCVVGAVGVAMLFINEWEGSAFTAFVVAVLVLLSLHFGPGTVADYVWNHVLFFLGLPVLYFLVAPFVMLMRWVFFNWDAVEAYEDGVRSFESFHGDRKNWSEHIQNGWKQISVYKRPLPREHRKRLIGYMLYWPLHFVDLVIREFFWRLLKRVYQLCIPLLDHISEAVSKSVQPPTSDGDTKI